MEMFRPVRNAVVCVLLVCLLPLPLLARDREDEDQERRTSRFFSGRGEGGVIPDGIGSNVSVTPLRSTITVPDNFRGPISTIRVDFHGLAHTWPGDFRARLIHPDGITAMDLFSRPGRGAGESNISSTFGFGADFVAAYQYSFADNGTILFLPHPFGGPLGGWQEGPFIPSGIYRPSSNPNPPEGNAREYFYVPVSFAQTFGGKRANGAWTLEITEWANGFDTGSLEGWTLNICSGPCPEPTPRVGDERFKLTPFNPGVGWTFGWSLAASGSTALIGSPNYSSGVLQSGAAYLFDISTGRQTALMLPTGDVRERHSSARSVAIDRDTALVGNQFDRWDVVGPGLPTGSVSVYDVRDSHRPVERFKLIPADATGARPWWFGRTVALHGKLAVVAAEIGGEAGLGGKGGEGKIYLFNATTGEELSTLTGSDTVPGDGFGWQLALRGNMLVVGAPVKDGNAGAVYVFDVSDPRRPIERFKLTAADAGDGRFGDALAIGGTRILVGAPSVRDGVGLAGTAYLFDSRTGRRLARLSSPMPPEQNDRCGWSVAIRGDLALIGAPFSDSSAGSAHLFDLSDPQRPVMVKQLTPSDAQGSDWFGMTVAIAGDKLLVGARQDFSSSGKVTVFQGPPEDAARHDWDADDDRDQGR
jgi:hypothetical protein